MAKLHSVGLDSTCRCQGELTGSNIHRGDGAEINAVPPDARVWSAHTRALAPPTHRGQKHQHLDSNEHSSAQTLSSKTHIQGKGMEAPWRSG